MKGILRLAYKLLVNDKSKFTALLLGITFAVFLMMFVTSMFSGVLNHASATIINIGASIWVMDPAVETVTNSVGMPDYVLDAVRSMQGVKYAVPLYSGGALVKLSDGTYQSVTVIGLDDTSLFGRPALLEGKIEDIYAENGFIAVRDAEFPKLENPHIGSEFELNDHRGSHRGHRQGDHFWLVRHSRPCTRPTSEPSNTSRIPDTQSRTCSSSRKARAIYPGSNSKSRRSATAHEPKKSSCKGPRTSSSTRRAAAPTS